MTSVVPTAQSHVTVLQFLVNHGYHETAEVFKREASHYLEPHQLPMLLNPLAQNRTPSTAAVPLSIPPINDLSNPRTSRTEDIREGDDDYYTTLVDSFSDIHSTNILVVAVEPQTNMIATSCVDNMVKINTMFCSDDSILSEGYRHHQAPVLSIDFHPTYPQLMLTTSMDGSSALVDISCENDTSDHPQVLQRFSDHERYVVRGVFSSHRYFATASYDHTVIVYQSKFEDIANRLPEYTLLKQFRFTGNVETICFYDDEILIVGVRNDSYLHYIRLSDMAVTRIDMKSSDWASSTFSPTWISVSPDGRHLLCTTDHASGLVILFALGEQRQVQNYYIHPTENGITTKRHLWHRSGLYFYALGGDDNSVAVVETKTGRVIHSLTGHQAMIRSMAMSDIGLVTAGYDHTIKIWSKPTLDR